MRFLPTLPTVALTCLLGAAPLPGLAQVYKCERNGTLSYSDQPCTDKTAKSQALDLRAGAGSALRESASLEIRHYDVHGQSLDEVMRQINSKGPQGYHGMATWRIDLRYESRREGAACRIVSLELKNQGSILMPRWVEAGQARRDLGMQWDRYYAALKRHEDGHIATSTEFQTRVRQEVMSLAPQPCDKLPALVQQTYDRLHKLYTDKDAEYDRRTRHGLNQDAPRGLL